MTKYSNFLAIFIGFWFSLNTANSFALDSAVDNVLNGNKTPQTILFKLVGQGTMRWLWFDIYQAKLSTPSGTYVAQQWPLSLELIYARHISREDLIKTTEDEWRRQSINYQEQWLTQLNKIWPNISPKDKLLLQVDKEGSSQFFYNNQYLGSLNDKKFTLAFTAIWLSDNTLKPALRDQLIGFES
ncbi:MAG: chalcone isomerase family protein [Porticoccaceae bacterium]|nr:chalcone isomerase family protein [Porticoccaceae bacterium]